MNDQELAATVRQSVEGARMDVPEEQVTSRGRAIRSRRRRRVAAGVTAIAAAGAAAIAAALILPGPAAVPAAQDTAYVVSHATQALTAVPPGTISFVQSSTTRPGSEATDSWAGDGRLRIESFTRAGQPVSERVSARTSTTETVVLINYRDRTWTRRASHFGKLSAPAAAPAGAQGSFTCDSANKIFGIPLNPSDMAASLRDWESCGWLKADGTATAGGVTAIRLIMPADGGSTITWYVSPATYLPIRQTVTRRGTLLSTNDFQWLPPTAANLARLALPAVPRGFTEVKSAA